MLDFHRFSHCENVSNAFLACECDDPVRFTGNCAPGDGKCECAEAYRGDVDCKTCADGYYDDGTSTDEYPNCKQVLQIHIFKPQNFSNLKKVGYTLSQ